MKNKLLKYILFFTILFCVNSCSNPVVDVKSPCVSNEDGPCGVRRPVNNWWLGDIKKS